MIMPPAARPRARAGKETAMEILLVLILVGVILWATGHLVMH